MRDKLRVDPSDRPATIAGAAEAWTTLHPKADVLRLRDFVGMFGATYLDDVDADILIRFQIRLRKRRALRRWYDGASKTWAMKPTNKPLADETVRNYVQAASRVVTWAHERGWIPATPDVPELGSAERNARDVAPDRLEDVFAKLPKRAGRILRFIAETGCRPGEACKLEWEHVHLDAGVCILPPRQHKAGRKTKRPRKIYLTDDAAAILRTVRPTILRTMRSATGPVFLNRFGKPYTSGGLRSILKRHGGIVPYQLRHSFAQNASDRGVTTDVLAALLGNTERAAKFYSEVRDHRAIAATRRLGRTIKLPVGAAG